MYEKDNIVARCFIKLKHGFFSTGVTEIQEVALRHYAIFEGRRVYAELNTNGNIQFKKEGDKYFISIDKRDTSPCI